MTHLDARLHTMSKAGSVSKMVWLRLVAWIGAIRKRLVVFADAAILATAVWTVLVRLDLLHGAIGAFGILGNTFAIPGAKLLALLLLFRLSITPGWMASVRLHREFPIWSLASFAVLVVSISAAAIHAHRPVADIVDDPFFPAGTAPCRWPYYLSTADHETIRTGYVRLHRATPEHLAGTTWPHQARSLETYPYLKVGCETTIARLPATQLQEGFEILYTYVNWQSAFYEEAWLSRAEALPATVAVRMRGAGAKDAAWQTLAQADINPQELWWKWFDNIPADRRWLQWAPLHVQSTTELPAEVDIEVTAIGPGAQQILVAETGPLALREEPSIPPSAPRHIVLVSIDTLAASHVSHLGYHRPTTPNMDAFAERSVAFESAFAAAPWTAPSHWAMLTGLTPSFHGVYPSRTKRTRPYESVVTLAELLQQAGYRTAAFTGGYAVSSDWGFHRGFDLFHSTWQCLPPEVCLQVPVRDYRKDVAINTLQAIRYVREHKEDPFFLFLHTYEPHAPGLRVHDFEDDAAVAKTNSETGQAEFPDLRSRLELAYDSDIRAADQWLGQLLDALEQEALLDDALVIIVSDHGETFRPNELDLPQPGRCHGYSLYDDELHVPFVIHYPKSYAIAPTRISSAVSLVDVCPTILECAGIAMPRPDGVPDWAFGQSLLGISRNPASADPSRVLVAEGSTGTPSRIALRQDAFKFVRFLPPENGDQTDAVERLSAWRQDPLERVNALTEHPDIASDLGRQVDAYEAAAWQYVTDHGAAQNSAGGGAWRTQVNNQQLRSIGYVD